MFEAAFKDLLVDTAVSRAVAATVSPALPSVTPVIRTGVNNAVENIRGAIPRVNGDEVLDACFRRDTTRLSPRHFPRALNPRWFEPGYASSLPRSAMRLSEDEFDEEDFISACTRNAQLLATAVVMAIELEGMSPVSTLDQANVLCYFRTPATNRGDGQAQYSMHLTGGAVDIRLPNFPAWSEVGLTALRYDDEDFTHLDIRRAFL